MKFLHQVSERQHRMVKNYTVLDFTGANTADLLFTVIPELNKTLESVTKVYCETVYRVVMINAPGTIATLIGAVSVVLSERQCAKIVVLEAPTRLTELSLRFRPDTLL